MPETADDLLTCDECDREVHRRDAFPVEIDGQAFRVCRDCRAPRPPRNEFEEIARRKIDEARLVPAAPPPTPEEIAAAKKARWDRAWESAAGPVREQIGRRYEACTRDGLDGPAPAVRALWAAADAGASLLIFGPNGTGKTHAAAVIFREALAAGRSALFRVATELVEDLRVSIEKNDVRGVVVEMRRTSLLVIDDLAMERPTEWVLEQLCRVIDWRYRDGSQTVITSNLQPAHLAERYGPRLWSRIVGLVGRNLVHLAGRDRREDELRGEDAKRPANGERGERRRA